MDNSCDAAEIALKAMYDAYGICAGRYLELLKVQQ